MKKKKRPSPYVKWFPRGGSRRGCGGGKYNLNHQVRLIFFDSGHFLVSNSLGPPPIPQYKKLGLRATKDLFRPIDSQKMPKIKRTSRSCPMLMKMCKIIQQIPLPTPNKKNWALWPQKYRLMKYHSEVLQNATMSGENSIDY